MCRLRNIALESVTDGRTDDGQSDPYVSLCFAGDTKIRVNMQRMLHKVQNMAIILKQFG